MTLDLAGILRQNPGMTCVHGTVTVVETGQKVTINTEGMVIGHVPVLAQYSAPAVGDVVLAVIVPDNAGTTRTYVLGKLAATTAAPPPPPPPPATSGVATFPAVTAGSYRGGTWRDDRSEVIQGDFGGFGLNQGTWFYSGAPAATLAGAAITEAQIWIDRRAGGDFAPRNIGLYLHNASAWQAAPPARVSGPVTIGQCAVGEAKWLPLPAGWGAAIAAGTNRGVGIYQASSTPYVVLASLAQSGQTGALRLSWTR